MMIKAGMRTIDSSFARLSVCIAVNPHRARRGAHESTRHACVGPRSWALARDQRDGLDAMLDATDVLLLTQVRPVPAPFSQHDLPNVSLQCFATSPIGCAGDTPSSHLHTSEASCPRRRKRTARTVRQLIHAAVGARVNFLEHRKSFIAGALMQPRVTGRGCRHIGRGRPRGGGAVGTRPPRHRHAVVPHQAGRCRGIAGHPRRGLPPAP